MLSSGRKGQYLILWSGKAPYDVSSNSLRHKTFLHESTTVNRPAGALTLVAFPVVATALRKVFWRLVSRLAALFGFIHKRNKTALIPPIETCREFQCHVTPVLEPNPGVLSRVLTTKLLFAVIDAAKDRQQQHQMTLLEVD